MFDERSSDSYLLIITWNTFCFKYLPKRSKANITQEMLHYRFTTGFTLRKHLILALWTKNSSVFPKHALSQNKSKASFEKVEIPCDWWQMLFSQGEKQPKRVLHLHLRSNARTIKCFCTDEEEEDYSWGKNGVRFYLIRLRFFCLQSVQMRRKEEFIILFKLKKEHEWFSPKFYQVVLTENWRVLNIFVGITNYINYTSIHDDNNFNDYFPRYK